MGESLKQLCDRLRAELLVIENQARTIIRHPDLDIPSPPGASFGEARASSMLAVRHLEDARMRLGKVLQWARDGVSCNDKAVG